MHRSRCLLYVKTEYESVVGCDLLTYDGNVAPALILQELCHKLNAINLHKQEAIAHYRQAQGWLKSAGSCTHYPNGRAGRPPKNQQSTKLTYDLQNYNSERELARWSVHTSGIRTSVKIKLICSPSGDCNASKACRPLRARVTANGMRRQSIKVKMANVSA